MNTNVRTRSRFSGLLGIICRAMLAGALIGAAGCAVSATIATTDSAVSRRLLFDGSIVTQH